jgi:hypothetical protein
MRKNTPTHVPIYENCKRTSFKNWSSKRHMISRFYFSRRKLKSEDMAIP